MADFFFQTNSQFASMYLSIFVPSLLAVFELLLFWDGSSITI